MAKYITIRIIFFSIVYSYYKLFILGIDILNIKIFEKKRSKAKEKDEIFNISMNFTLYFHSEIS